MSVCPDLIICHSGFKEHVVAMLQFVRMTVTILIFLLMIHGVSSADWGVNYSPSHICALKDSSVIMSCTYTYPTEYQIMKVFWTKTLVKDECGDLSKDPEYSQRLQYLGDRKQNCTIRLSHVTHKDSHKYYFRFVTNKCGKNVIGTPGVSLTVTDLQVESPERVTEGDSVRLTCKSSCTLTDRATFIWYRNSQPLTERRDTNNELLLQSVRREDAGRYSCALHGHTYISPAVHLSVTYSPKSVSVFISPSHEIVEGDSVTMNCSSDSNPPAKFSWFKGGTFVRSGRIYRISKIRSDHSGKYKCKARNEHGEKYSHSVTLNVMYPPKSVSVSITGSAEIVEGDSVTLICSSDSNPPAEFSWFKENQSSSVGSGQSFSALQSGRFFCEAHNQHGSQRSDAVTVTVKVSVLYWKLSHTAIVVTLCGVIAAVIIALLTCSCVNRKKLQSESLINNSDDMSIIFDPKQFSYVYENVAAVHPCTSTPAPKMIVPLYENVTIYENLRVIMVMSVRMAPPLPLIFMLMIHRAYSEREDVRYSSSHICALKNSSVIIGCTFTYPTDCQIERVFWTTTDVQNSGNEEFPDLSEDPEYSQRLQYLGDKKQNCTIRLSHVTHKDSHKYYFRFTTDKKNVKWIGKPGVSLTVTDLQVESPERVTEGDSVRLTCKSSCTLTDRATFIWYRNSQPLTERRDTNNELLLQSVRREDAGRYSCALHGHTYISPAVHLNVTYAPKNVSVSISPSGEIVEGDSVTLSCSSDSNPPAEISWLKGETFVGSGRIYSISNISSDHSGEYKCKSINEHGEKYSEAVTLNVMCTPRNVSVSIIQSGLIWEGDSVTLICSSDSNPPALNFSWFKENQSSSVGSGQSFSALQSGRFYCEAHNQHGSQRSDTVTVIVKGRLVILYISIGGICLAAVIITMLLICVKTALLLLSRLFVVLTLVMGVGEMGCAILMSVRMATPLPLIFLLMIHRVYSADWGVNYSPSHICALKDSSVIMSCTYTYPTGYQIINVFWTNTTEKKEKHEEFPDLSEDPKYSQRLRYLGDKQQNCTIRLSHVTQKDSHMYYFRFTTDKDVKWVGTPGVSLTVTDLQVESPERVTEGDSVRLTCKSSCTLTDRATFIWYRNSQPLTERRDTNNELLLQSVRREDAGRYSCALHGHTYISPAVHLNVTYAPKNVSVFISSSGEIVEGDSVTLICSSDSNPPAKIIWFKGETFVGSGRIYSISKISSDDSKKYRCKSINKHGGKYSDTVTLNIMYPPRNISVSIIQSGLIWEGDSVTLICSSDSNPPAENSWFKENQSSSVGSGQSFSALQSGHFYCEAHNQHGSQRSDAITVIVKGHLVTLYICIGGVCVAAVIIMIVVIWECRWINNRNGAEKSQIKHSRPRHGRHKTCNVETTTVYENVMAVKQGSNTCKTELNLSVYKNFQ
ncbi:hypothetical protein QQF64_000138, partial [Cirrhinus molitorella]